MKTAETTIKTARRAAQDHGAERFIHNNADAGTLGECGLCAVRVVLDDLLSYPATGPAEQSLGHLLNYMRMLRDNAR